MPRLLSSVNGSTDIIDDTTPQLGGNLDLNSNDITGTGDINITGVLTATSFVGDGSSLTGVSGGSGVAGISTTGTSYFNDINLSGSIFSDSFRVRDAGDTITKMFFGNSGSGHVVRLYANGNERLSTNSNGIFVQNEILTTDIKSTGICTFNNVNFDDQITYTASTNRMKFGDDAELRFGDGDDLSIYHTAGDIGISYNSEGVFFLRSNNDFQIDKNGSKRFYAHTGGAVDLYYAGNKRLETTSDGIDVTGDLSVSGVSTFTGDIHLNQDNATLRIGANVSGDIRIYHTGTESVYYDNYGVTKFLGSSWDFKNIADNKTAAHFDQDSGQELYYNGTKRFETTSDGIVVTGIATITGGTDAIGIQSGGVNIATGIITALNFIGAGNTFAVNGNVVDISIAGGSSGGGGGSSIDALEIMLFT